MSLTQIIEVIGKNIVLCNSFVLNCIKFIFGIEVRWTIGLIPHCYGNLVPMATRLKHQ